MERVLLYHDTVGSSILVLEMKGKIVEDLAMNCGPDFDDWPLDISFDKVPHGLVVWEGNLDVKRPILSHENIRGLTANEWIKIHANSELWS